MTQSTVGRFVELAHRLKVAARASRQRRSPYGAVAASVGCALSRARTGMPPEQMTCAIPGRRLADVVERLESAAALDRRMANYAGADARRFGS